MRLQTWLLGVAAASFCAGLACGIAAPAVYASVRGQAGGTSREDADEEYVRQFADTYGLTREQQHLLRLVRQQQEQELHAAIDSAARDDWDQLPPALRARIRELNQRAERRIEFLLDAVQRARFLADKTRLTGASRANK